MKPGQKVELTAGTIAAMSERQFRGLQYLCMNGQWESLPDDWVVRAVGTDPLGVYMPTIFIGIEKDGYTHS